MRRFSLEAIVQGAIAFALIDAGVRVREAYRAGAKFAYLGDIGDPLGRDENAPLDPVMDRLAGRLYAEGETYLIYAVGEIEPHEDRFVIISDANPSFDVSAGLSAPEAIRYAVGGDGAAPCILLNLSEVCAKIATALGIPFAAVFLTEAG